MKFATDRPYADPEQAARKIVEIAKAIEPVQDGRIHIEKINEPFLYKERGSPAEYGAGIRLAVERGWLLMHESAPGIDPRFRQLSLSRQKAPAMVEVAGTSSGDSH